MAPAPVHWSANCSGSAAQRADIGSASITLEGVTVGAIVAVNALGDVIDPATGATIAGARTEDGRSLLHIRNAILDGAQPNPLLAGTDATLAVVATDAVLTKAQAHRLAQVAHDRPRACHRPRITPMSDGDTVFALGTGKVAHTLGMMRLATLAAEVTARAVVRAVRAARGITTGTDHWPAACDLAAGAVASPTGQGR